MSRPYKISQQDKVLYSGSTNNLIQTQMLQLLKLLMELMLELLLLLLLLYVFVT